MKIVTAELMRRLDRTAIDEIGIPGLVLMENAGAGCAQIILTDFCDEIQQGAGVLCGAGNNGGDGFVIARHLWNNGVDTVVYLMGSGEKLQGDTKVNYQIARNMDIPVVELTGDEVTEILLEDLSDFGLVVDALFGTGLDREVEGRYAEAIDAVNTVECPVFAVDIPSGVHADTGKPMGTAVYADATATFGLSKLGHWLYPGNHYCGKLHIVDISIPWEVVERQQIPYALIGAENLFHLFLPRNPDAHKGHFGHALILGGSTGLTGAPAMAGQAAMRTGAGLVTVAVPTALNAILETKLTEVMTAPLGREGATFLDQEANEACEKLIQGKSVVAIGPGLGRNGATREFLLAMLPQIQVPVVLDADALWLLADHVEVFDRMESPVILTPHPGEMSRLSGQSVEQIQENRIDTARNFAKEHGLWVALKGGRTVVADPDGQVFLNATGNPGMASGGTGDVLTGMIAGLIAQAVDPSDAVLAAVYLHGMAGDQAARTKGEKALTAGDLLEYLPPVLHKFERLFAGGQQDTEPAE